MTPGMRYTVAHGKLYEVTRLSSPGTTGMLFLITLEMLHRVTQCCLFLVTHGKPHLITLEMFYLIAQRWIHLVIPSELCMVTRSEQYLIKRGNLHLVT